MNNIPHIKLTLSTLNRIWSETCGKQMYPSKLESAAIIQLKGLVQQLKWAGVRIVRVNAADFPMNIKSHSREYLSFIESLIIKKMETAAGNANTLARCSDLLHQLRNLALREYAGSDYPFFFKNETQVGCYITGYPDEDILLDILLDTGEWPF